MHAGISSNFASRCSFNSFDENLYHNTECDMKKKEESKIFNRKDDLLQNKTDNKNNKNECRPDFHKQENCDCREKKEDKKFSRNTLKYVFPLELRKFCTFENVAFLNSDCSEFHEESENEADYSMNSNDIESDLFDDNCGAVFYPECQSLVGAYLSSPILNWNEMNFFS
ncbi:hypothetical protein TRFO_33034 [Tritrichomonas foetus]|uniref:Uncharacterized protein n=1 Tax=Tritrichomonas foetus TaxID=1144522 RepID=A0A1J4JMI6_9EUKA|nr:hypothetical protein TRFO_33034 [Tritrichomonas foetus]|eukprot:OHT00283.1 hypothetical protein TRFO_33034 [Tritrichomonas foetus]